MKDDNKYNNTPEQAKNAQTEQDLGWQEYFAKLISKPHRPRTEMAVRIHQAPLKVAVDCGCGTGADTAYLATIGYQIQAFDSSSDALAVCNERFKDNANVIATQASFAEFNYPPCGIFMANASLYFADEDFVHTTWLSIVNSIETGGIFIGDFLGERDEWLTQPKNQATQQLLSFSKEQVQELFSEFEILKLIERDEREPTALQGEKHWHSFMVVARKSA